MTLLEHPVVFRIILGIGLVLMVFMAPAWLTFLCALIPVFFFQRYAEFIFISIVLDLVYQTGEYAFLWGIFYTLIACLAYFMAQVLKRQLFIYHR